MAYWILYSDVCLKMQHLRQCKNKVMVAMYTKHAPAFSVDLLSVMPSDRLASLILDSFSRVHDSNV